MECKGGMEIKGGGYDSPPLPLPLLSLSFTHTSPEESTVPRERPIANEHCESALLTKKRGYNERQKKMAGRQMCGLFKLHLNPFLQWNILQCDLFSSEIEKWGSDWGIS